MNKRTKLLLAAAAVCGLLYLFSLFFRLPFFGVSPEDAIPVHTALFFSGTEVSLKKVFDQQGGAALHHLLLPKELRADLDSFQVLFKEKITLPAVGRLLAAVHPTRSTGIDVLYVADGFRGLKLQQILASSGGQVRQSVFKNHDFFTCKTGAHTFAFAKYRNLLLFSRYAYLVENAVSQLKSPATSICRGEHFTKLAAENNPSVFVNLEQFAAQFAPLIQPSKLETVQQLGAVGNWYRLDLPLSEKNETWTGAFTAQPTSALLAANGRSGKRVYKSVFRALPDNLTAFAWVALKNFYPSKNGGVWDDFIDNWAGYEAAVALGEPLENEAVEQFVLLHAAHAEKAEKGIEAFAQKAGKLESYAYQMFDIHQAMGEEAGGWFTDGGMDNPYMTVLGEYVLFSNSKAGMERWLDKYIAGQTLSKDAAFLHTVSALPDEAHGFLFAESEKSWQLLAPLLDDRLEASLSGNPLRFRHLAATMERKGEVCRFAIVTPGGVAAKEEQPANILWKTPLADRVTLPPFAYLNPQTKEVEVLTQDAGNQLYLIARSGRILWRRKLQEPVRSKIFPIDLNNDGETQLAFSTPLGVYVISPADGSDVDGFPLKLQTPASNGVTVVDFFNSHDYRFFIACENGLAYGFDEKGSPVEGWRPHEDVGLVEHPLLHFQEGGKDYLVLLDTAGTLQVYQKNGAFRFPPKKLGNYFRQAPDFQAIKGSGRIVACDTAGRVSVVNLAGDEFKLAVKAGNNRHLRFAFANVTGDERNDYIALSGKELAVYAYEKDAFKQQFKHTFPAPQSDIFGVGWGKKTFIGAYSREKRQIHLLDSSGRLLPQFPLAGTSSFVLFDLLNEGKPVAVVGYESSVYAYSLE